MRPLNEFTRVMTIAVAVVTAISPFVGPLVLAGEASAANSYEHAVVAADHPLASEAGAEILRRGGNVVDAAVAVAFTLSVVRPESCGIGGGGFMVIWDAEGQHGVALDYRERAPAAATADMFLQTDADGARVSSERGGRAIGVPGEVAGLLYALEHYGTLSRDEVLAPALRIARTELEMDRTMRESLDEVAVDFQREPQLQQTSPLYGLYVTQNRDRAVPPAARGRAGTDRRAWRRRLLLRRSGRGHRC